MENKTQNQIEREKVIGKVCTDNQVFEQFKEIISEESYASCKKRVVDNLGSEVPSFFHPDLETAIEIITYKLGRRDGGPKVLENGGRCSSKYNPEEDDVKRYNIGGREVCLDLSKDFLRGLRDYALKIAGRFALKEDIDFGGSERLCYQGRERNDLKQLRKYITLDALIPFFNKEATYELLQKLITISALPLKELEDAYSLDSSGFGSYQYERWMRTRFYGPKTEWRNYVKGHVCIGTRTNVICSAEITYGNESDVKQVPKLLEPMMMFSPKEISGDKAYNSRKIFQLIDAMNAVPFIAFKSNTNPNPKTSPEIWTKMYNLFRSKRHIFLESYHKRSNVETVFSMVKMRLGEFLKSKNFIAQRNELLTKFLCHNICCLVAEIYEREIHIDFNKENTDNKILFK
ncbi:MAG: transposase [archaeon]